MNDYKELIGELKEQCPAMDYDCCELAFRAADAIEQLVAERDAAVADLYELFTKDESPCAFCIAEHCDKCIINYPYWEWRGVRSEENVR